MINVLKINCGLLPIENKILFGPPPKKGLRDTNVRYTATRTIAMSTRNVQVACWV